MRSKSILAFATALVAGVAFTGPVFAQVIVAEAPAVYRGRMMSCETKYPGSFPDIGMGGCWECPSTHPNRTAVRLTTSGVRTPKVTDPDACERPASSMWRKASGPETPSGLTDCRSGYTLEIFKGCYGCPWPGFRRTMETGSHPRACERVIPAAWTRATRKGDAGCASDAFQNGLMPHCYTCPRYFVRNAVIADDLTKVNACSRVEISEALRNATLGKFNFFRGTFPASSDNLGRTANSVTSYDIAQASFDLTARELMKTALEAELLRQSGFHSIGWLVSAGGSFGVGATHQLGYVMTKEHGKYHCRKAWSHRFTAGIAGSAGVVIELELSEHHEIHEGKSEWNGWQIAVAYPPLTGGYGLHWNATDGTQSLTFAFGPGFDAELNLSEYAHTFAEAGKVVPCEKMTWGPGWLTI